MSDTLVISGIIPAGTLASVTKAAAKLNPFLEHIQNRTSAGAITSIFPRRKI